MKVAKEEALSAKGDQQIFLHDISWESYEAILAARGDHSGVRIAYLEGELELMSPSWNHEFDKKLIARVLEAYAEEVGIELLGVGSWTIKSRLKEAGAEPDECYVLGVPEKEPERPHLAIEVVRTSGGLSKLEIYRRLGVPEVWFWEMGELQLYALEAESYKRITRSTLFPHLDLALLQKFAAERAQTHAVRGFREALRSHV